jgi:hypothetical protein
MAHYITSAEFLQVLVNKSNGATLEVIKDLPNEYHAVIGRKDSPMILEVKGDGEVLEFFPHLQLPSNIREPYFEGYEHHVHCKGDQIESSWLELAIDYGESFTRAESAYTSLREAVRVIEEGKFNPLEVFKKANIK